MSNAPYTPPSSAMPPPAKPQVVDYDDVPPTGVRKVLEAYEERSAQRARWGAVIGGLVIALATQVLLGMLGVAVGLTAMDPRSANLLSGFGAGAGLWMGFSALIGLFLGGYAAAKLAGSIRRSDGIVSGLLTWATSLVIVLWLVGSGVGAAASAAASVAQNPDLTRRAETAAPEQGPQQAMRSVDQAARANLDAATRGAWYSFGGACVSLLAAIAGGALGAAGLPRRRGEPDLRDRRDQPQAG